MTIKRASPIPCPCPWSYRPTSTRRNTSPPKAVEGREFKGSRPPHNKVARTTHECDKTSLRHPDHTKKSRPSDNISSAPSRAFFSVRPPIPLAHHADNVALRLAEYVPAAMNSKGTPVLSQYTAKLTMTLSSNRNRRRLLQRRRLLLRLRPDPVLRPRPARHGQHPLPHRHHAPPRPAADVCVLRAQEQVERHAGVLGGRAVDSHEVAADRVCGGDVWDICSVWGECCRVQSM